MAQHITETQQNIRIGDKVRLSGHFTEECWKTGTVAYIWGNYVVVRYGFPLDGFSKAIDISELERVN